MNADTDDINVRKERNVTISLALLASLLVSVAAAYASISSTREQVSRNTTDITVLNQKVATDHDLLIEIRGDVKRLLQQEGKRP